MSELDDLSAEVKASVKYRHVAPDFIRSIGAVELSRRNSYKEAVKATRNKLHQVGGAYLEKPPRYETLLTEMRAAVQAGGVAALRPICSQMMSSHASTHERLPVLEQLYTTVFGLLPRIHSVLDIACGFNPLALPWMPLATHAAYDAIDIYEDLTSFLQEFIVLCGCASHTRAGNVLNDPLIEHKVDLAILLKAIPCLEQVDKRAGTQLLDRINADHLLISFPVHSLGGRSKGMSATYETHFMELVRERPWTYERLEFATELVFLVTKSA